MKVVSATEDHDVHFHRVHLADMGRVRTRKVCELDDQVVSQDEIGKGYEIAKDQTVPVTDEELDAMPLPTAKAIEIAAFVDAGTVDPVRISDSYYLAADGQVAAKPYTLLRKALERSSKVAVAKFAWHGRERLGPIRIREGAIVLHSMKWPDEVRSPESLAPREVGEDEIEQALQLADRMTIEDLSGFRTSCLQVARVLQSCLDSERDETTVRRLPHTWRTADAAAGRGCRQTCSGQPSTSCCWSRLRSPPAQAPVSPPEDIDNRIAARHPCLPQRLPALRPRAGSRRAGWELAAAAPRAGAAG